MRFYRITDDPSIGNLFCLCELADLFVDRSRKGDGEAWGTLPRYPRVQDLLIVAFAPDATGLVLPQGK